MAQDPDPTFSEETQLLDQPPTDPRSRATPVLIGLIAALAIGVVAVGVALVNQATSEPASDPTVVVGTAGSTAVEAGKTVSSPAGSSIDVTSTAAAAAPILTTAPGPGQPAGQQADEPAAEPTTPPIPAGHVDSCAYPQMAPTVVSSTTYTPRPTPTVTVVTSPETCPPYSAGYPWDGS